MSVDRPTGQRWSTARSTASRWLAGSVGDGLALSVAAGGSAVVGMVSWVLAARMLSPAELGTATAFVSAFLLISGVSQLNLGVGLLRWLPAAGAARGRLVASSLAAVAVLAATVSLAYLAVPGSSIILDAVTGPGAPADQRVRAVGLFVLAAMVYAMFHLQDFVLVGLGRPWWAPGRTLLFAVGRIGILLAVGSALTSSGVVLSWIVPTGACVVLVAAQCWYLVRRGPGRAVPAVLPGRRAAAAFLGPAYVGQIATSVLFNQVPLLVVFRFGTSQGAVFFLVWQAVTVVDVVAQYFSASLSAGVGRDRDAADELSRAVRRRLLLIFGPGLVCGMLLAEPVLALFGPVYAAEAWVLRLMLCGLAFRLLVVHRLSEHQALGRSVSYARLSVVTTAFVVGAALLVPASTTAPLTVIAVAFVAVQVACAGAVTLRSRSEFRAARTAHHASRTLPIA